MRNIRDAAGVEWTVYLTIPSVTAGRRVQHLAEAYRNGWLVFESAAEKRRFAPVPAEWATLSDQALAALCGAATPQPLHRRAGSARGDIETTVAPAAAREPDATGERKQLRGELQEVTTKLVGALERVCDDRAGGDGAERLDTGELIRVEETLAMAAAVAKEAVTLRRRLRAGPGEQPFTRPEGQDPRAR